LRILTEGPFENVYIQPAAGDNGLALGCAYYGWLEILKREKVTHDGSTFFGAAYPDQAVRSSMRRCHEVAVARYSANYIHETAALLAAGRVVGWFQGCAEFGPRALGNRSILADPRRIEMRDFINRHIKNREDFRPFAPAVLEEDASIYFNCDYESPYMLLVAPVRPEWRGVIPSVIHQDKSARLQTVSATSNPAFYQLLQEFKRITGLGILLNTSFNKRGMPIVETPEQAVGVYLDSALDVLVMNGHILVKTPATAELVA
jgi:carbamoyltransferase